MTDHRFEVEVPVRYRDLDTYGHVNNANYATFLEEGRIAYFEEVLELGQQSRGMILASLSIEFHEPVEADAVTVGLAITRIGSSSFDFAYEIAVDGRRVATAESVQIAYDVDAGESIPFPDEWRATIEDFEGESVPE